MKKIEKIILIILTALIAAAIAAGVFFFVHKKIEDKKEGREQHIAFTYDSVNAAFGMGLGHMEYMGSDQVDAVDLYVNLYFYEKYLDESDVDAQALTMDEVYEFLSSEYDEDGNLKILNLPDDISAYIDWYTHGGENDVEDFWDSTYDFRVEYAMENDAILLQPRDMTEEQITSFIEKLENEDYSRSEKLEKN